MPNARRGEIEAILDGRPYVLCLTLGALAELETAFGDDNMLALARRFEAGQLSSRDIVRIIGAGLRGAGHDIADEHVGAMRADGGIPGFVDIVARLLTITFTPMAGAPVSVSTKPTLSVPTSEVTAPRPFPGTT